MQGKLLTMVLGMPLLFVVISPAQAPINCGDPEITSGDKRDVKENYLELIYDADTGHLEWRRHFRNKIIGGKVQDNHVVIPQDTIFPPFAYAKERILVKVCNAKFDADVSAVTAITQIPESGPDIHGLQQNSTAATPAAQTGALLAFTANPAATGDTSGIVVKLAGQDPNGERLALEYLRSVTAIYDSDFRRIESDIASINCGGAALSDCNVDSLTYITNMARQLNTDVAARQASADGSTNSGAFELLATRTTNLVSSLNNLVTSLAALTISDRISKLLVDSQSLAGAINGANQVVKSRQGDLTAAQSAYNKAAELLKTAQEAREKANAAKKEAMQPEIEQKSKERDQAKATLDLAQSKSDAAQPLRSFATEAQHMLEVDDPSTLVAQANHFDTGLNELHQIASKIFHTMNTLHANSKQVIATVLPPQSTNAVISVSIIVHDGFSPFGFAPAGTVKPSGTNTSPSDNASNGSGTDKSSAKAVAKAGPGGNGPQQSPTATPEQHVVRRVLIEVHRRAEFNIVGGFTASTLGQRSFGLREISATNTNLVVFRSQDDRFQLQPLVGLNMYLRKRDLYPGYLTPAMRWTPGILLGTSVSNLGNFMIGPNFEPVNGLDFYGGLHVGHTTDLASGIVPGVTQFDSKTASAPTVQTLRVGLFFGIGFDASIFKSIFQKSSSQ